MFDQFSQGRFDFPGEEISLGVCPRSSSLRSESMPAWTNNALLELVEHIFLVIHYGVRN